MAVAKKKTSSGMRKSHGPKRNLFHNYPKGMRNQMARAGMLNKYTDYESFVLAIMARGIKTDYQRLWSQYFALSTIHDKREFLKGLK